MDAVLFFSNFEILSAGHCPRARPLECMGIAREDEIYVVEFGACSNKPILEIQLPRMKC